MTHWHAYRRVATVLTVLVVLMLGGAIPGCLVSRPMGAPIKIGLIAPLSGGSATSGEAIQRGMLLAIDEVNAAGGVLGRPLELITRDVQNDPRAGVDALRELVEQHQIVTVFGGIFSPVMMGQIDTIHELQVPLINPWGSVTEITRNGRDPNYAFRVSVSDVYAGEFLVRYAIKNANARRPGIIADTTAWGDSNVAAMTSWLNHLGVAPAGVERFDQGETNMTQQLSRLRASNADTLLMIANAPEGAAITRGMATLGWKVPVISHWGISGGRFVDLAGIENADGVLVLQTFSFIGPLSPRGEAVLEAYHARFGTRRAEEVLAPVGVAHGFDGVHLLARAIQRAETTDGPRVREALERLDEPYDGLVKQYAPAFTPDRHDALLTDDYIMAVWNSGHLVPARQMRIEE
jgi:branched-chain amino acid transport system substrate-binding protein